jgi:hypothetical protein
MQDLTELIPSKDVRKYIAEQGHDFSDFEKAMLIYNHPGRNLKETEQALQKLAQNTRDKELVKLIEERIAYDKLSIETFIANKNGFVYILEANNDGYDEKGYFASYEIATEYGIKYHNAFTVGKVQLISGHEKVFYPVAHSPKGVGFNFKVSEHLGANIGELRHDAEGNIFDFFTDEIDSDKVDNIDMDINRFENSYMNIPHPFRQGDFVKRFDSDEVSIVLSPASDEENKQYMDCCSSTKNSGGLIEYMDCCITVLYLNNGKGEHEHINPAWLEYTHLNDDDPLKEILENALKEHIG